MQPKGEPCRQDRIIQDMKDPCPLSTWLNSDLRERGQWWPVPGWHSRNISVSAPPPQVLLGNRDRAVQEETINEDMGSLNLEVLPRLISLNPAKMSHCHRRLPCGGDRRPNVQTRLFREA